MAAPRELVFEVVAAAGKKISDTEEGKLVEFETRLRDHVIKTTEEVELDPPNRIAYRWVEGPLDGVEEEIRFEDVGTGTTNMTYTGWFHATSGSSGWLRSLLFVRPAFNKLVTDHLEEGKRVAEKRAERSRLHPRRKA